MAQAVYRAAVVGLGVMGQIADALGGRHPLWFRPCSHADAYEAHPRTELVAGATRSEALQERFRRQRQRPVYGDYRELLERERPDLLSVATPATVHAEIVLAAAEAGVKAIWCEKAMATSLVECDRMIAACERAGVVLAINHQRRWDDRYRALQRAVDTGTIGKLQAIQIHFGGGRLCRGGSHAFDLARWFAGAEVRWGLGWLSDPEGFDPGGTGVFETENGVRMSIDGAAGMRHGLWMELVGEGGILKIIDDGFELQLWTPDDRPEMREFRFLARHHLPQSYPIRSPFLNALDDLIQTIETGTAPRSSGSDGRAAFEMITAIHLSHRRGKALVEFPVSERDLEIPSN